VWIEVSQRSQAQSLGYTVVDASTVVATHLNQILYKHSHELIGHEEVQQLMQLLAKASPKLAEELVPGVLSCRNCSRCCRRCWPNRCRCGTFAALPKPSPTMPHKSQDTAALVAAVRVGLSRAIVQSIVGVDSELPVITLEPRLEQILLNSMQKAGARPGRGRSAGAKHG
jgi:flagellar biosynthesis protein FlhA